MDSADKRRTFDDAKFDELVNEPPVNTPGDKELTDALNQAKIDEHKKAIEYRDKLVGFTRKAVGGLITAATAFMAFYIWSQWNHIEESVIIAYFGSVVLEVVGILYVIAQYLFPKDGIK